MTNNSKDYNTILLFDTSVVTENLGDFIIMDAVRQQLHEMFPNSFLINAPTHDTIGKETRQWAKKASYSFVGGTNLLTNRFKGRSHSQWKFGFRDSIDIAAVGIGLGWGSYKKYDRIMDWPLDVAQSMLYKRSLSTKYLTSVRDSYSQQRLGAMGIASINTACVTMWNLTEDRLSVIPKKKADMVVTTITNYWKTPEYLTAYKKMIDLLLDNYRVVKLWVQAREDIEVFAQLHVQDADRIQFISPSLTDYDEALSEDTDYIGTRLHAGIRALQHQRRTLIVELDNRAHEIAKDTNLPTVSYKDIESIANFIHGEREMDIHVPFDKINQWKQQFLNN
ncbi:polysaccharide pyruvyl transferase family protein [Secundilactobacillus collinoides]|nr:polysaccharide pyruvyl transferase family protein [Secundilactobacillus collinoides]